jgi:fucose 4-O-acetylase-like acetyltransferase
VESADPAGKVVAGKWSPLIQLGRTSLFIYWIHVEMIYGLVSRPIHHSLSLTQALLAYVLFAVFMLGCSIAKERVVQAYGRVRARPATASPAS